MEARLEDGDLVEQARAGDHDAFAALVRAHQRVALHVAFVTCGSRPDAEDVVQEAFVKAWHALHGFRRGAPFRPWLLAIVANEARNRRRAAGRRQAVVLRAQAVVPPAAAVSAEESAIGHAILDDVLAAVGRLPDRERLVVAYRHLVGLSERETAEALGVRPGTVKSRLSRGLARLRADLAEEVAP